MSKSSLFDQSDAYIFIKGTTLVLINNANNANKKVVIENCAPFTDCISKVNKTQVDNAKDIDIAMSMYKLIKYSNNYSKASQSLWQYHRIEPVLTDADAIVDLSSNDTSDSFNFEEE